LLGYRATVTILNYQHNLKGVYMNSLSENAMQKLDEMLSRIAPIASFLNQKVGNGTITGQLDIQRIHAFISSYNEFLAEFNQE